MKIVLVGYGEMFQALVLGILKTEHKIVGVFRHENVIYPAIKKNIYDILKPTSDYNLIKTLKLHEIKAKSVNSQKFINEVKQLKADIIIVGSWSEKFSPQTLNIPKEGCINIHPSLLPKYRGPNPYLQVILNNEEKTGITFHFMDVNYDTGGIIKQAEVPIEKNDTGNSLKQKCCKKASKEIINVLNNFHLMKEKQKSQNEKEATYQHNISLSDSILDFKKETSAGIERRIRALTPWLNCHICINNEFFTFSKYKILPKKSHKQPSTIVKKTKDSIYVVCADNSVMKFSSLKIKRPFSKFLTQIYLDKFIKLNDKTNI